MNVKLEIEDDCADIVIKTEPVDEYDQEYLEPSVSIKVEAVENG